MPTPSFIFCLFSLLGSCSKDQFPIDEIEEDIIVTEAVKRHFFELDYISNANQTIRDVMNTSGDLKSKPANDQDIDFRNDIFDYYKKNLIYTQLINDKVGLPIWNASIIKSFGENKLAFIPCANDNSVYTEGLIIIFRKNAGSPLQFSYVNRNNFSKFNDHLEVSDNGKYIPDRKYVMSFFLMFDKILFNYSDCILLNNFKALLPDKENTKLKASICKYELIITTTKHFTYSILYGEMINHRYSHSTTEYDIEFVCTTVESRMSLPWDEGGAGSGGGGSLDPKKPCPAGKVKNSNGDCVDPCVTKKEDLKKVFPNTNDSRLTEIANFINKYGKDFGIDTKEKLQHFLAQAGHESNRFRTMTESMNFMWKKLGQTGYFKKYFNTINNPTLDPKKANPNEYKRGDGSKWVDGEKFANLVYGTRNGNTQKGDGYKYRGRGAFQLTGRYNYEKFAKYYKDNYDKNVDLLTSPDLIASNTEIGIISAFWFFKRCVKKINENTTVKQITKIVNGGSNGIKDRKELHSSAKTNIDCYN